MKASSISKMNTIFGFLVPKMLEMSNFIDPTQLFQKLRGLLFCNFQYLKVPCAKLWRHHCPKSKIQTWITQEIMKILTYFFLQIFIIFDGLFDSSRKWETILFSEFPFNGTNFRGEKFSRISRIFWKLAKINPREIFCAGKFAKINPRETFFYRQVCESNDRTSRKTLKNTCFLKNYSSRNFFNQRIREN